MTARATDPHTSGNVVLTLAGVVIVAAGLKAAASLLIPIALAAFLAVVALPCQVWLRHHGLPKGLAIVVTLLLALGALTGLTTLLASSLTSFAEELPDLRKNVDAQVSSMAAWLSDLGWEAGAQGLRDKLDPNAVLDLVNTTIAGLLGALSSFVVILLLTVFALVEAEALPAKLRVALQDTRADLTPYEGMARAVGTYAFWKTALNLVTGGLVALVCWLTHVREPVLWGLLAFLFNFIPNVGSLIVAVPIVVLAWADLGSANALLVGLLYVAVNQVVGSVVEPRLMGKKMGLSPLVVLLSLLVWGWLWGPVGMLLSVPLTMIVRSLLLGSRDGHALAVILGPAVDEAPRRG